MQTTRLATVDDAAMLAALWTSRKAVANSCWEGAIDPSPEDIDQLLASFTIHLVERNGAPWGFCYHNGPRLVASCGLDRAAYAAGLAAYAAHALAAGHTLGTCIIDTTQTIERGWLDSLDVATFEDWGFEPISAAELAAGQSRVPVSLLVTADLAHLQAAAEIVASEA